MDLPITLRVSLLCALLLLPALPAASARASSSLDIRAGYDTDPGDVSDKDRGDSWAAVTGGTTVTSTTGGPLTLSFDLALGATAYARLTDLDRLSLVLTPALAYVISPRVAAMAALVTEGQFVSDAGRSAWGWGVNLRLREQLSTRVDLTEYLSYRDLNARDAEYSGTKTAIGFFLRTFLGRRWMLGVGGEYAHGDFPGGDALPAGDPGMGSGSHKNRNDSALFLQGDGDQTLVREEEDRLSGSLVLDYAWSERLSSGAEYSYTRVTGAAGGDTQQSVIASTTFGF